MSLYLDWIDDAHARTTSFKRDSPAKGGSQGMVRGRARSRRSREKVTHCAARSAEEIGYILITSSHRGLRAMTGGYFKNIGQPEITLPKGRNLRFLIILTMLYVHIFTLLMILKYDCIIFLNNNDLHIKFRKI